MTETEGEKYWRERAAAKAEYRESLYARLITVGVGAELADQWSRRLADEADRLAGKRSEWKLGDTHPRVAIGPGLSIGFEIH